MDINKLIDKARIEESNEQPNLWYFHFPSVPGFPTMIGEHGTKDEAIAKVKARLQKGASGQGFLSEDDDKEIDERVAKEAKEREKKGEPHPFEYEEYLRSKSSRKGA